MYRIIRATENKDEILDRMTRKLGLSGVVSTNDPIKNYVIL